MIYIDSSVALAFLFAEDRAPPPSLWEAELVSSRLLEYEIWSRMNARPERRGRAGDAHALIAGIDLIDLTSTVLARALEPFPLPVRTLDALHLATIDYLRANEPTVELATYDSRLLAAARALGIGIAAL